MTPRISASPPHSSQKQAVIGLALLLVAAAAVRLCLLDSQSLWFDEGYTLFYSGGATVAESLSRLGHSTASERLQPLYFVLLHWWRAAFGDHGWALRFFSVLFGVAAVPVFYAIGSRLAGRTHGLLAAGFGAFNAFLVFYSQEVRPYAFLLFVAVAQFWLLVVIRRSEGSPSRFPLIAFWCSFAVSLYGSILFAIFSAALFLSDFPSAFREKRLVRTWAGAIACAAVGALAVLLQPGDPSQEQAISLATQSLVQNAAFTIFGTLVGATAGPPLERLRDSGRFAVMMQYWPVLAGFGVFCLAFAVSLWNVVSRRDKAPVVSQARFVLGVYIWALALGAAFAVVTRLNWQPRHSFFLAILPCILLPFCVLDTRRFGRTAGLAAAALFVALNGVAIYHQLFDPAYARDDYRSAAAFVRQHPDTPSVLVWGNIDLLRYYGDQKTIDGREFSSGTVAEDIRKATGGAASVLVLVNREFYWGSGTPLEPMLHKVYSTVSVTRLPYFAIYRLQMSGPAERDRSSLAGYSR